jgi:hypothetical protein
MPVGLALVLHFFLSSPFITARVLAKLEELYGGKVQVGGVDVKSHDIVLHDVAFFESNRAAEPWLTVDRLEADISPYKAVTGGSPSRVELHGVTLILHFDDEGRLLNEIPSRPSLSAMSPAALPEVTVTDGKLRMLGPCCRQIDFDNVSARLVRSGNGSLLNGQGQCSGCGDWTVEGCIDTAIDQLTLSVRSKGQVTVTQSLLDNLPFVPPITWREVQADGRTTVVATFTNNWRAHNSSLRVELQPSESKIHVSAINLTANSVGAQVVISDRKVQVCDLHGELCGGRLELDASLDFRSTETDIDIARLVINDARVSELPTQWSLAATMDGKLHTNCRLHLTNPVSNASASWRLVGAGEGEIREARIHDLPFDGPIRLALQEASGATNLTADMQVAQVDIRALAERLEVKLPADTKGAVTISGLVTLPLSQINDSKTYRVIGSAQFIEGRVAGWEVRSAQLQWKGDADRLLIDAKGEAYGGYIHGNAEIPLQSNSAVHGQMWLQSLDLGSLVSNANTTPISGSVDGEFTFQVTSADFSPSAKGHVTLSDLAWNDEPLTSEVQADLALTQQELKIGNANGTVFGGNVSGQLVVNRKQRDRSWFQLDLANAELSGLLHSWPAVAEYTQAQGTVDIRLAGTLGADWTGNAEVVVQRGKLLGIDISEWRAPVRWTVNPTEGRGEVEIRDSNAQVAQGRVTAQASATWSSGLRVNSQIQFVGVNLHQAFQGNKLGNGRATGRIDISSERLQSIDDLQATLSATVQHTQALDYPVFRQVAPFIGLPVSKTFQSGEINARLAKNMVHVEKLALSEGPWQLYAVGNVTLKGNVNLEMTASTGKLGNLAATLGWRVPQTGFIGREQLMRATTALSPQLVHLHIRGTVREPTVQVVPLPIITEQALRFFAGS